MSFQKAVRAQAAPYLHEGESIDAAFGAATRRARDRIVVVTNRRILVFPYRFRIDLDGVPQEFPRSLRLAPAHRFVNPRVPALGPKVFVNWHFYKELVAADAALDARSAPPD